MNAVCTIELIEKGTYPFLRKRRATGIIKQPGEMQSRQVSMVVKSLQTDKVALKLKFISILLYYLTIPEIRKVILNGEKPFPEIWK